MAKTYIAYATKNGLKSEYLEISEGRVILKIMGSNAFGLFKNEVGKHVVQRCPPTENKGRRHTSVVTVSVLDLPPPNNSNFKISPSDIKITWQTGTGPGGQNKNRSNSMVRMRHLPTNIEVCIDGKSPQSNKELALKILTARVKEFQENIDKNKWANKKREQWTGGGRGNKVRTYNFIESRVTDNITGVKSSQIDKIMKGHLELLQK